jgi:hypothetical protein
LTVAENRAGTSVKAAIAVEICDSIEATTFSVISSWTANRSDTSRS